MDRINVTFLDKEYSVPSDVITYVGLVDFANEIKDFLMSSFNKQISHDIAAMENDSFMVKEVNDQVSKFIAKLLENDIYDKTATDYLHNSKGYGLFTTTKEKILRQIIAIRKKKLDTYEAGVQEALSKKEASVTGLDFGIISSSFVNHMIYAYMDASKQTKQEKEALEVYNREIAALRQTAKAYDEQERNYIINNVVPAMNTVFTYFIFELLDRYVSDLIRVGKFDKAALKFINLERSNDLLKNLDLAGNKKAVIESAFVACPFNVAVYMQAMKYDWLDYSSFQTAKIFKQDHHILSFFRENWGEVSFPSKFNINYHCINVWALLTAKQPAELLRDLTAQYATSVVKAYSNVADMIHNNHAAARIMREVEESVILQEAITKNPLLYLKNWVITKILKNC